MGCRACEKICPQSCIIIKSNKNGFLIPQIDQTRCIKCGLCSRICPIQSDIELNTVQSVFAAYSENEAAKNSTSGGIFYELAYEFIENDGVVYGASYSKDMYLSINEISEKNAIVKIQGSKYLQADTRNSFVEVRDNLEHGIKVLYSGTPCQVAGLKKYLALTGVNNKKLYTVEIICHGVSSPKMFYDYLKWQKEKNEKNINRYVFRSKRNGFKDFRCEIGYSDNTYKLISGYRDPYYRIYMKGNSFRESCYNCKFANKDRVADITLGDFWNSEELGFFGGSNKRISVVLINSEKGEEVWKRIQRKVKHKKVDWEIAAKGNSNLYKSSDKPMDYMAYGKIKNYMNFFDMEKESKVNLEKEIFNMLPFGLKRFIKKIIKR